MRTPSSRRKAAAAGIACAVLLVAAAASTLAFRSGAAAPAAPTCGTLSGCLAEAWRVRTSAPRVAAQCDRYTKPDGSIAHSCLVGISDGERTVCVSLPASLSPAMKLREGKATIADPSECSGV